RVEPLLAAHLVAQAIVRRQADMDEPVHLTDVADAVREVVRPEPSAWASFLAQVEADRQAHESRLSLARLLSREGGKEAVGDRPVTVAPTRDDARQALREAEDVVRDSRPADVDYALCRAWRAQEEQLAELPLPQGPTDLHALRFDDGIEVTRGQVIRFGHP